MGWAALLLLAQTLYVGEGADYSTIAAALADASPGDTIRVQPGIYREHLIIETPVVLMGQGRAVIDGGGEGTVITVLASRTVVNGFEIRGSGSVLDSEDAGIMVQAADTCEIVDNVLSDVLFGVYLKESDATHVADNRIRGKDLPLGVRGDGIRLWYSHDDLIEGNHVEQARDVVVFFSHGLNFRHNHVSKGRYGLHYMYSDHNRFERNEFVENDVAAFLMYSSDIILTKNVFARASGRSGFGIGLKDSDHIEAIDNLIVQNQVGVYLDNSPSSVDVRNRFEKNVFAFNDVAVSPLPSVRSNDFANNAFHGNVREITVSGGGTALANRWHGNVWDGALAWDEDDDGTSDFPYRIDRLSDDLIARHPELRLFELSPAAATLDALGRFFPLLEPKLLVVDSAPRLATDPADPFSAEPRFGLARGTDGQEGGSRPLVAIVWLGVFAISIWGVRRWPL